MLDRVMTSRWHDIKILFSVVCLVTISVMNLFTWLQCSAEHLRRYKPVFVYVATNISERMPRSFYKHVTIRRDGSSAFPCRTFTPEPDDSHVEIVYQLGV